MKRNTPERHEQNAIIGLLRSIGTTVYTLGTVRRRGDYQGTMQSPGLPDLYAFLPPLNGRPLEAVWIEVKGPTGKLSAAQTEFKEFCDTAGHAHIVGGIDVVILWLRGRGFVR